MSAPTNSRVISIYNSRCTILKLMEAQGFVVDEHAGFSINEVDSMFKTSQLDMLLTTAAGDRKAYVKYKCDPKKAASGIRPRDVEELVEDLYFAESVLSKSDTLVVVSEQEPIPSLIDKLRYMFDKDGVFVVVHNIKRLQFNILEHELVPPMEVLGASAALEFMREHNVRDLSQLPEISRFDPQALAMGVRPGQICRFQRQSVTSMDSLYYRACV